MGMRHSNNFAIEHHEDIDINTILIPISVRISKLVEGEAMVHA